MKRVIIALLFISNSLFSQNQNVDIIGRIQIALPTAEAIDGLGGQLGLRFSSEYSAHKYFGFEAFFDNRRYSIASGNTKVSANIKNLQLGFPFMFGETVQFSIMPCISIHVATKVIVEQGNTKIQIPDSIVESSDISMHDKSIVVGISKQTSPHIALSCSGQYVFATTSKTILQVGLSYRL